MKKQIRYLITGALLAATAALTACERDHSTPVQNGTDGGRESPDTRNEKER